MRKLRENLFFTESSYLHFSPANFPARHIVFIAWKVGYVLNVIMKRLACSLLTVGYGVVFWDGLVILPAQFVAETDMSVKV